MRPAAALAALAAVLLAVPAAPAEIPPFHERPPEDEIVVQLLLGGVGPRRLVLSDALLAYRAGERLLLPLGELSAALDFALAVDTDSGRAEGWFLAENRRFSLDALAGEVWVDGRRESLPDGGVERHWSDLYVDSRLLARWFPLELELDLPRLVVEIRAREPFPVQERLARAQQRGKHGWREQEDAPRKRLETPRALAEISFLDMSQQLELDESEGLGARYSTLVSGDLLFMDAMLHLAGEDGQALDDVRLTLGRKDPQRGLLGPLAASEFQLGDIFTPQLPLVSEQQEGRGVLLSSFPLDRPTDFDRTTLRGDLPLGWDAELYRNGVLLDARATTAEGRYEFVDVPLVFGMNRLELLFYGPQGQRRSEVRRVWVGPSMVPPGEQRYRGAFIQHALEVLPASDDPVPDPDLQGLPRLLFEYERGLDRRLSLALSAASLPLDDARHDYASVGLRASLWGALARLDATVDSRGGQALLGSLQTELGGISFSTTHEQFYDFVSERAEPEDALRSRTRSRVDGTLPTGTSLSLPYSFAGTVERGESGRLDAELGNRLSLAWGNLRASHQLDLRRLQGSELEGDTRLEGAVLLNARLDALQLRGGVGYELDPTTELTSLALGAERRLSRLWGAQLGLSRELRGSPVTTLSSGVFGHFQNLSLGLDGSFTDEGDFTVGLALSFGAARDPRTGALRIRPNGLAADGAASARVFLDANQNGHWDMGEELLQGVRFERLEEFETDPSGLAFVTGLSSYRPTTLRVDTESLEDPFWLPAEQALEIVPRPGKTALLEFPVTPTGEIDGTVYVRRGDASRPAANVRVQLYDRAGALRREVRSEFDGFYLFDFVPPGHYEVGIASEQTERLDLPPTAPRPVEISGNGAVAAGVDLVIDRSGPQLPPPPAQSPVLDASRRAPERAAPLADYRVQLASYLGPTRAQRGWERLRAAHREELARYRESFERVVLGTGVAYRLQVGPLGSERAAGELCQRLHVRGTDCLVVAPDGSLPAAP